MDRSIDNEMREVVSWLRQDDRRLKAEKLRKQAEREARLRASKGFTIHLQHCFKPKHFQIFDEFEVEDYSTALELFELYRGIGHGMHLKYVQIDLGDEKVKRVNFKY
jgi:hypothetical protein